VYVYTAAASSVADASTASPVDRTLQGTSFDAFLEQVKIKAEGTDTPPTSPPGTPDSELSEDELVHLTPRTPNLASDFESLDLDTKDENDWDSELDIVLVTPCPRSDFTKASRQAGRVSKYFAKEKSRKTIPRPAWLKTTTSKPKKKKSPPDPKAIVKSIEKSDEQVSLENLRNLERSPQQYVSLLRNA
jgi:hypothetical protein